MLMETAGVDVNDESALRSVLSPLAVACQQGYFELVKLLLANPRVDVNRGSSDPLGMTPLCFACQRQDNMVMIKMLLKHEKIDVNAVTKAPQKYKKCISTPLTIACGINDAEKSRRNHGERRIHKGSLQYIYCTEKGGTVMTQSKPKKIACATKVGAKK